ncbi:multicopper oxidase family protein [Methylomicrobium agile]|uniref:multicopper oxidase family protein n=1 Tax=Methylomicrobium agile TaxID=39774 RepID=UPI0004DF932C|nr:multicopper oxidase domain-containing protein [Methylomicrobium agile]
MPKSTHYSRRRFLTHSSLGLLAFAGMPRMLRAMEVMQAMPKIPPLKASANFKPDVEFELYCRSASLPILPGKSTLVQQYTGNLIKGPEGTLVGIPNSYLGPLVHLQKGQKVRIHLHNKLAEPTITHWHGLHVPAEMDGHPRYTIDPGETFVYEFEVLNRASMNIYHPHPHEITAKQVYHGLAGALFVHDGEEAALELPSGEYEIPLVIQDRRFDDRNQLLYASGMHGMHDRMMGYYGDRILVNGLPDYTVDVDSRAYRLRFLNGSTARIYKLGWDDGTPLTVLGVDGGLLETPESKPYVMLAPGERLDVWADFSGRPVGSQLVMRSLSFSGVLPKMMERMQSRMGGDGGHQMGMMGGMMHESALPVGSNYPIFTVRIKRKVSESPALPKQLSKINRYRLDDTANANKPVPIAISEGHMAMLLNGRPYAFDDVQPNERIPLNTVQLMEIFHAHGEGGGHGNSQEKGDMQHGGMGMMGGMNMHGGNEEGGMMGMGHRGGMGRMGGMHGGGQGGMMGMGMMMSMAHPIHLHGQSFQIVSRSLAAGSEDDYETVRHGFIESGWKDTVLVMPGETVRIIKPFQDFKGLFMYHCHNLEHEDMGMMRDFLVE